MCPVFETIENTEITSLGVRHEVQMLENGEKYLCPSTENLLKGMSLIGRKCIPVGCVNGGCGICKVAIISGDVRKCGPMSRCHVSEQEELQGVVLACRVSPMSKVELVVVGKMKNKIYGDLSTLYSFLAKLNYIQWGD